MTTLVEYLNLKFPDSTDGLVEHFSNEFGVNAKIHSDGRVLFKYDQLAVKWDTGLPHYCRGHILAIGKNGWEHVSRPADKFFNLSEGRCPVFKESDFISNLAGMRLLEKVDGSCLQIYFFNGKWRVSTLGTIDTMAVGESGKTFEEMFWEIVDNQTIDVFNRELTYVFEFCSPYNRIVTDYGSKPFVKLLFVRSNKSGEYLDDKSVYRISYTLNVARPVEFSMQTVHNFDSLNNLIERISDDDSLGKNPEGLVIYINGVPSGKVKTQKYLALHRLGGGDPLCSRNNLIDLFLAGAIDDVYGDLLPEMKAFCDAMGEWSRKSTDEFLTLARSVRERNPETQKDYALLVKDSPYASLFFMHKEKVLNGTFTLEDFTIWVRTRKPSGVIETLKTLWRSSLDSKE
jgi:hypothetical protein